MGNPRMDKSWRTDAEWRADMLATWREKAAELAGIAQRQASPYSLYGFAKSPDGLIFVLRASFVDTDALRDAQRNAQWHRADPISAYLRPGNVLTAEELAAWRDWERHVLQTEIADIRRELALA